MKYQYVLFDLDGTITKSDRGIYNALAYTMQQHNLPPIPQKEKHLFIGPPLHSSFMNIFHVSMEEADSMVHTYREYYSAKGKFESELYEGIPTLLKELKKAGYTVALATSKIITFVNEILNHFDIYNYFDVISGADLSAESSDKSLIIHNALTRCGVTDKAQAVMVGDRLYDIQGAKNNGIDSIGVLYGYGSREELKTAGATHLAETVSALLHMLVSD
jgi:phosphoglycolate phosphatase